jgi:uncharacterized OB-fold protein
MSAEPIQPVVDDHDTAAFFAAAREGRLVYKACADCGAGLHPPTEHCPHCGGWNSEWRESGGAATLYSWSVAEHQIHPAYPTPYTIAVVTLDDAPDIRFVTHLPGRPELSAGQPMRLWFERRGDDVVLPQWRPA